MIRSARQPLWIGKRAACVEVTTKRTHHHQFAQAVLLAITTTQTAKPVEKSLRLTRHFRQTEMRCITVSRQTLSVHRFGIVLAGAAASTLSIYSLDQYSICLMPSSLQMLFVRASIYLHCSIVVVSPHQQRHPLLLHTPLPRQL